MICKLLIAVLTVLALSGCGKTPEEAKFATSVNAQNPETVATLPDGRIIQVVKIVRPGNSYDHYVYFVSGAQATTNYSVSSGKTSYNQVNVTDLPIPQPSEQDKAEYKRLKTIFGQ